MKREFNPYESSIEKPTAKAPSVKEGRSFLVYCMLPSIHSALTIYWTLSLPAIVGPNADASAMSWAGLFIIDFPTSLVAFGVAKAFDSQAVAITSFLLLGGIHWFMIGFVTVKILRWLCWKKYC